MVAGFFVLLEDQYRIGDSVKLASTSGEVEEIRLRVTVLRDIHGNVHYVPNGEIRVATNMTRDYSQVVLDITVGFESDVDRIIAVLTDEMRTLAAYEEWEEAFLSDPEVLGVDRLRENGVVVRMSAKVRPEERWRVQRESLRRIKNRLDHEGIDLPSDPIRSYQTDDDEAG